MRGASDRVRESNAKSNSHLCAHVLSAPLYPRGQEARKKNTQKTDLTKKTIGRGERERGRAPKQAEGVCGWWQCVHVCARLPYPSCARGRKGGALLPLFIPFLPSSCLIALLSLPPVFQSFSLACSTCVGVQEFMCSSHPRPRPVKTQRHTGECLSASA